MSKQNSKDQNKVQNQNHNKKQQLNEEELNIFYKNKQKTFTQNQSLQEQNNSQQECQQNQFIQSKSIFNKQKNFINKNKKLRNNEEEQIDYYHPKNNNNKSIQKIRIIQQQQETDFSSNYQSAISLPSENNYQNGSLSDNNIIKYPQNLQKSNINIKERLKSNQINHNYRPDIDGIRAIAVLSVVIFHAYPKILPGGFVGVDIFFVISGYLISQIIIKQTKMNKFSYIKFYERRIRRIYPSLIVVLGFSLVFGFLFLQNRQFSIFSHTMSYASIFSANLQILLFQKGYFDPDIQTNSMLHLWSLGVEEQFYIIWPLIIGIVVKKLSQITNKNQSENINLDLNKKNSNCKNIKGLLFLIIFTLISFAFSIYSLYKVSAQFAFYFPICRFWQMSIGGLIAYKQIKITNKYVANIFSIVSILIMICTMFYLNQSNMFPGFWALIPTFLCAFLIILGSNNDIIPLFNQKILSSSLFTFIGKLSYPLYLWHWPLLTFSRLLYPSGSKSFFANPLNMMIIAFLLTLLTYYVVEKPLRFKKGQSVVWILIIGMIIIGIISGIQASKREKDMLEDMQDNEQIQVQLNLQEVEISEKKQQQEKEFNKKEQINKKKQQLRIKQKQVIIQNNKKQIGNLQKQKIQKEQQNTTNIKQEQKKPIQKKQQKQKQVIVQIKNTDSPRSEDFILKNGNIVINSSKNRKRTFPTLQKLRNSTTYEHSPSFPLSPAPKSPFYDAAVKRISHFFEILNEDKNQNGKKLFIIGDSHAEVIRFRFLGLYEQAKKNKDHKILKNFPIIVAMARCANPYYPCSTFYNVTFNYVKKHKPDRILFVFQWPQYLQYSQFDINKDQPTHNFSNCKTQFRVKNAQSYKDTLQILRVFKQAVQQFIKLGIQVYASTVNPFGPEWNPKNMYDPNGPIQQNVNRIVKLSEFRKQNKQKIQLVQSTIKKAGAHIIDFSDNYCYEDKCNLLTPYGSSVMRDNDHFRYQYAKNWVNSVDFLVNFSQQRKK